MMEQSNRPPVNPWIRGIFRYPAGKRELIFGGVLLVFTLLAVNFTIFGGFNLGFAIGTVLCAVCSVVYLWTKGKKKGYALCVLALCAVIAAGFARSDDGFVKFVMLCFLFVGNNLGLTLLSGKNRFPAGSVRSLLDAPVSFFGLGIGKLEPTVRGMSEAVRSGGKLSKNGVSVLLGLAIAVPVLAIMIPLLISADAAFDGLMQKLPSLKVEELFVTVLVSAILWPMMLSRSAALRMDTSEVKNRTPGKGLENLTLNTVLIAVCVLYLVYLVSQLAYFVGGFAGLLPEEYTLARYARRGFFEMAWLCAINLSVMTLSMGLSRKKDPVPLLTRVLCLFIGVMTVFFVATASAKMFLYIGSYGLTRLRVLTQIIMLFLALTTVIVSVWLFVPKMPYMKVVILCALVIGAAVIWVDVDTQVADYNVDAYLSGKLETVDVDHLDSLGDGAVPAIVRLKQEAPSEQVRAKAEEILNDRRYTEAEDFRGWNYVNQTALQYQPAKEEVSQEKASEELMDIDRAYGRYFYDAKLEAFCVGEGYVCLRGWKHGSDEPMYCLTLPNGDTYEPVESEEALKELIGKEQFTAESYGNWIPLIESECCGGDRFAGIRGRSIEEDVTLWYVLDMENNTTHGPYRTEDEYWQACYDLKAYPIGQWETPEF